MITKKTKIKSAVLAVLLASSLNLSYASPAPANMPFTNAQQAALGTIIEKYLLSHPQLLKQMADKLQAQESAEKSAEQSTTIKALEQPLFFSPTSPVLGNPNGTVTLIEFEDYQCINCVKMYPVIKNLIQKNPNLRVIVKELPIFGDASTYAAKTALTYNAVGDFAKIHNAIYEAGIIEGKLKASDIDTIVNQLGLNNTLLPVNASDNADNEITQNFKLAQQLNLPGTPGFIVALTPVQGQTMNGTMSLIPGAISESVLQQAIDTAVSK